MISLWHIGYNVIIKQLTVNNSYLTFARTITRRARVRQLTIDSYQLTIVFTNSPRKRNVGAAGSPKQLAFWGALHKLLKLSFFKKKWYYQQHLRSHNATSAEK